MTDDVYLIGGGMHARVLVDLLMDCGRNPVVMVDPDPSRGSYRGVEVIDPSEFDPAGKPCIFAIGDNRRRFTVAQTYLEQGAHYAPAAIHPSVVASPTAVVGAGSVALPGSILDANCVIGENVIVNLGTIVGHDVVLADHVHASAQTAMGGAARVGEGSIVGLGATVCPYIVVGDWSVIGAGSVVVRNVPDNVRVLGIPAREG